MEWVHGTDIGDVDVRATYGLDSIGFDWFALRSIGFPLVWQWSAGDPRNRIRQIQLG